MIRANFFRRDTHKSVRTREGLHMQSSQPSWFHRVILQIQCFTLWDLGWVCFRLFQVTDAKVALFAETDPGLWFKVSQFREATSVNTYLPPPLSFFPLQKKKKDLGYTCWFLHVPGVFTVAQTTLLRHFEGRHNKVLYAFRGQESHGTFLVLLSVSSQLPLRLFPSAGRSGCILTAGQIGLQGISLTKSSLLMWSISVHFSQDVPSAQSRQVTEAIVPP